jgi:hypothetical protein
MFISDYRIVNLLNKKGFYLPIRTTAPTTIDAVNWLLQRKNIFIQIEYCFDAFDENETTYFFSRIVDTKTSKNIRLMEQFKEPEMAREYGIGYVLEKMI